MENTGPSKEYVLVVGNKSFQNSLMAFLGFYAVDYKTEFEIVCAENAETAMLNLETIIDDRCILIICNNHMAFVSGVDLFVQLKESKKYKTIPFLLFVNGMTEEEWKKAERLNIEWIKRPCKSEQLFDKVDRLICLGRQDSYLIVLGDGQLQEDIKGYLELLDYFPYLKVEVLFYRLSYDVLKTLETRSLDLCVGIFLGGNILDVTVEEFIGLLKSEQSFRDLKTVVMLNNNFDDGRKAELIKNKIAVCFNELECFEGTINHLLKSQ
jgi:hypothetical protein